jgi:uncharacterized protein YggE
MRASEAADVQTPIESGVLKVIVSIEVRFSFVGR